MPSKTSEQDNPYAQLADLLHELYWLASQSRGGNAVSVAEINRTTDRWDGAERLIRRESLSRGIPFKEMDAALSEAKERCHELVQVAAGNESYYFHPLDLKYPLAEKRLRALGATSAGADAGSEPAKDTQAKGAGRNEKNRRGRPCDTDPELDKRIYDAWKTGHYKKYDELAAAFKLDRYKVKLALDREGKRRKK